MYESKVVREFIDNLRNNTSFLYDANEKPDYITNYFTKNIYTDLNMIIVNQAMRDKGKKAKFVISENQTIHHRAYKDDNAETVCSAMFENFRAKYKKGDYEVVNGYRNVGDRRIDKNGKEVPLYIYSPLYSTEDVYRARFEAELDENGKAQIYQEDVYATEITGEIMHYSKSYSYKSNDGQTFYIHKGDPMIVHEKGQVVGKYVRSDVTFFKNQGEIKPAFSDKDIVPLYKRKNESGKEILIEKMTEAFRGKLLGNYKGLEITNREIDAIENEFISHPRLFANALKQAQTRARGDREEVRRMDENILRRQMSRENSNSNYVTNQMENVSQSNRDWDYARGY